jgi:NADH:ubiquinone oxidoreductase subunit E
MGPKGNCAVQVCNQTGCIIRNSEDLYSAITRETHESLQIEPT